MLTPVPVSYMSLDRFRSVLAPERFEELERVRAEFVSPRSLIDHLGVIRNHIGRDPTGSRGSG